MMSFSAPNSRSSPVTLAATRSTWRWSAGETKGAQQHLVELEGHQGRLACRKENYRDRPGPPRAPRSRRAVSRGCRPHPRGTAAYRIGGFRHPARQAISHQRGAGRPRRGAAGCVRSDDEGPAIPCRGCPRLISRVHLVLGEPMQRIVEKVLATPKPIAVRAKGLLEQRFETVLAAPQWRCYLPLHDGHSHRKYP